MANLRCAECGRYVNEPKDHDETCVLFEKREVYVKDEPRGEAPEPDHEEPTPEDEIEQPSVDVEQPEVPGVETKDGSPYADGTNAPYLPHG
jgi:hypothetical protein